jgi:V/A-type H+-transporting ATPase subunit E
MISIDENAQALSRAVLGEARAEAEQILSDARAKAEAMRQRAQEQAQTERQEILERARREAEHVRSQCLAAARLRARKLRLERREKLLDQVFDAARQRMSTIQQWTDYDQIVRQWVREAVAHLGSDTARIRADEHTRGILADGVLGELSEELNVQLQLVEPLERGLGVVAETMDGHLKYDNTLEARLERWQDLLRSPVYWLLMGETR